MNEFYQDQTEINEKNYSNWLKYLGVKNPDELAKRILRDNGNSIYIDKTTKKQVLEEIEDCVYDTRRGVWIPSGKKETIPEYFFNKP